MSVDDDGQGLPLPPPRLVRRVAMDNDVTRWLATGKADARIIRDLLADESLALDQFDSILDFGIGCGRVARWWRDLTGPAIAGCDYDGELTGWCRRNLPFLTTKTNASCPPLPFRRASFDFVYAISLFTHLDADAQDAWIGELRRITRPGGIVLFSLHGDRFADRLSPVARREYERGGRVVTDPGRSGQEGCTAYHPPSFVRDVFLPTAGLDLVQAIVDVDRDPEHTGSPLALQDTYLAVRSA